MPGRSRSSWLSTRARMSTFRVLGSIRASMLSTLPVHARSPNVSPVIVTSCPDVNFCQGLLWNPEVDVRWIQRVERHDLCARLKKLSNIDLADPEAARERRPDGLFGNDRGDVSDGRACPRCFCDSRCRGRPDFGHPSRAGSGCDQALPPQAWRRLAPRSARRARSKYPSAGAGRPF